MHNIQWIREFPEEFNNAMKKRGVDARAEDILAIDEKRRALITEIQDLQQQRNTTAKAMGGIKDKKSDEFQQAIAEAGTIKKQLAERETELESCEDLTAQLATLPNILHNSVPDGETEDDNVIVRRWGEPVNLSFEPKQHFDLGEQLGLMDFETAATLSGSRFVMLRGDLARMERALASFMLDIHTTEYGYTEVSPPYMVRSDAMYNAGQLPKFAEDAFRTTNDYWLIPTSEVPLVASFANEIIDSDTLPIRYTAYSPCFRSEAGSAGKDTRGMIRQHQFSKVEMVSVVKATQSEDELGRMTGLAEEVLKRLNLPYQVIVKCAGDTGFSATRTYDIEVWLPGQNAYREISSCSNCGDFQARRMKARHRASNERDTEFVHTLNGSGLAIGRTMVAILENYQNPNGSITIPPALRPYMGGQESITLPKTRKEKVA